MGKAESTQSGCTRFTSLYHKRSTNLDNRKLFKAYPELRQKLWKGQLWNHSYYVETVGAVSEDAIRKYIENQSKSY